MKNEEIKKKIIECFKEQQCCEAYPEYKNWEFNSDGCLMVYRYLEEHTKLDKKTLRPVVLEMRNEGLIRIESGLDPYGDTLGYLGCGYMLTNKGLNYINQHE